MARLEDWIFLTKTQGHDENSSWRIQGGRSQIMKNFVVHAEFAFYVSAMRRAFEPDQAVHKGF